MLDEKENDGGASSHDREGWTVRFRNPRDVSSVAVARTDVGGAGAEPDAAEGGNRPQVLALFREAAAGSKEQSGGSPKEAAARVIGKSRLRVRLCIEFDRREMIASKSQSIGRPKMVLTVTSGPRANEIVIGAPETSM